MVTTQQGKLRALEGLWCAQKPNVIVRQRLAEFDFHQLQHARSRLQLQHIAQIANRTVVTIRRICCRWRSTRE
jgi:hypothetical protein